MNWALEPAETPPSPQTGAEIRPSWLASQLGQRLLDCERAAVQAALDPVFGEELLQLGGWGPDKAFLQYARTRSAGLLDERAAFGVDIVTALDVLPLATASVDAVLLPHTLERVESPHELLREVHRVLRPNGCVLILGFGSRGPFGWRRLLSRGEFPPQSRQLLAERRVLDWLQLLNYRIEDRQRMLFGWPTQRGLSQARQQAFDAWCRRWLPGAWAGAYLLVARKRMAPAKIITRAFKRRLPTEGRLAEPSTRQCA